MGERPLLRHSFWLLKPHQKPVSCHLELYEVGGIRLTRDGGQQLFKFSYDKLKKWNVGKDKNVLELQIQVGRTGPAGSLKFQTKDSTNAADVAHLVALISKSLGVSSNPSESKSKTSPVKTFERSNTEKWREADEKQKASQEAIKKLQNERKEQSKRLNQVSQINHGDKPATTADHHAREDRIAAHQQAVKAKVEMRRSHFVTSATSASESSGAPAAPGASSQATRKRTNTEPVVRTHASQDPAGDANRPSIYSLLRSNPEPPPSIQEDAGNLTAMAPPAAAASSMADGRAKPKGDDNSSDSRTHGDGRVKRKPVTKSLVQSRRSMFQAPAAAAPAAAAPAPEAPAPSAPSLAKPGGDASELERLREANRVLASRVQGHQESEARLQQQVGELQEELQTTQAALFAEVEKAKQNQNALEAMRKAGADATKDAEDLGQTEALLLRSVAESSEDLGSLCHRLMECCDDDQEGGVLTRKSFIPSESPRRADADLNALQQTIAKLSQAVEAIEAKKLRNDEDAKASQAKAAALEKKLAKVEQKLSDESDGMRTFAEEAQSAADECARMQQMMDQLRVVAEEATSKLDASEKQRAEAENERKRLMQVVESTREEFESALTAEKERTRTLVAREQSKYEAVLKDAIKQEEERTSAETGRALALEKQLQQALADEAGTALGSTSSPDMSSTMAMTENRHLKDSLERAEQEREQVRAKFEQSQSDLESLTRSACTALDIFLEKSIHFSTTKVFQMIEKGSLLSNTLVASADGLRSKLEHEIQSIDQILQDRDEPVEKVAKAKGSRPRWTSALGGISDQGSDEENMSESDDTDHDDDAEPEKSPAITATQNVQEEQQTLQQNAAAEEGEKRKMFELQGAIYDEIRSVQMHLNRESVLHEELVQASKQVEEFKLTSATLRQEVEDEKEQNKALQKELEELRGDLSKARDLATDADLTRNAMESQCRTLALELASSKLEFESTFGKGKGKAFHPDFSRLLVVESRENQPKVNLFLELTDTGIRLAEEEATFVDKSRVIAWGRIKQIVVGISKDHALLDIQEEEESQAHSLRVDGMQGLKEILLNIILHSVQTVDSLGPETLSHAPLFGITVKRIAEEETEEERALVESYQKDTIATMSPAVNRISSISRVLARTHGDLNKRLLEGGLGHGVMPAMSHTNAGSTEPEAAKHQAGISNEEVWRDRDLKSKICSLEAICSDLEHKLASTRVSAISAVKQAHNIIKCAGDASRYETLQLSKQANKEDSDAADVQEPVRIPSWKPVGESIQGLLVEIDSFSSSILAKEGKELENEALLVAQAESELTQNAVQCLESLWRKRVEKLEAEISTLKKTEAAKEQHEASLLQEIASSRVEITKLGIMLDSNCLEAPKEEQPLLEGSADCNGYGDGTSSGTDPNLTVPGDQEGDGHRHLLTYRSPAQDASNLDDGDGPLAEQNDDSEAQSVSSDEVPKVVKDLSEVDSRLDELDKAAGAIYERVDKYFKHLGDLEKESEETHQKVSQIEAKLSRMQASEEASSSSKMEANSAEKREPTTAEAEESNPFRFSSTSGNPEDMENAPLSSSLGEGKWSDRGLSSLGMSSVLSTVNRQEPVGTASKTPLTVKTRKLESVVQNIMDMIG